MCIQPGARGARLKDCVVRMCGLRVRSTNAGGLIAQLMENMILMQQLPLALGLGREIITLRYPIRPRPFERTMRAGYGSKQWQTDTPEYRQYKDLLRKATLLQYGGSPLQGDLVASCVFSFYGRNHGDPDNLHKAVLDALQTIVFENDRQIKEGHYYTRYVPKSQQESIHVLIGHANETEEWL